MQNNSNDDEIMDKCNSLRTQGEPAVSNDMVDSILKNKGNTSFPSVEILIVDKDKGITPDNIEIMLQGVKLKAVKKMTITFNGELSVPVLNLEIPVNLKIHDGKKDEKVNS